MKMTFASFALWIRNSLSRITERKRAEEALRESNVRFRTLVHTAPSVILCLLPDGQILEFNPEAERLYGQKREDVLGKNYLELFLPEEIRELVADDIKNVRYYSGYLFRDAWNEGGASQSIIKGINHVQAVFAGG